MKNLIKCHFYYLVSRTSIAVVGLVVVVLGCSFIGYCFTDDESMGHIARMNEYAHSSLLTVRILLPFLLGFMYAHCFEKRNDHYCYFLLTMISRKTYIISKLILLFMFGVFMTSLLWLLFVIVGLVFLPSFNITTSSADLFLIVLLQAVIVGLYSVIFIQVLSHMLSIFIPFVLLLLSLSFDYKDGGIVRLFLWVFPNGDVPYSYVLVIVHLLLLTFLLVILNICIYERKDLNY